MVFVWFCNGFSIDSTLFGVDFQCNGDNGATFWTTALDGTVLIEWIVFRVWKYKLQYEPPEDGKKSTSIFSNPFETS